MAQLPLQDVRITDFSQLITGPLAAGLLALMGAEVIKVESQKRLDITRELIFADGIPGINRGMFNSLNLNKKSCTLDLSHPRGIELAKELVKVSNIVVEGFGYGVMERLGLSYSTLKEINPGLIYLSISGTGRTGPHKEYRCFGHTIHAYSGLTAQIGYQGEEPRGSNTTYTDPLTGLTGAFALMVALEYQRKTGKGQFIDMAMNEITLAQLPRTIIDATMNQRERGPQGNVEDTCAPHNCYPCKGDDKWVAVAITNESEWQAFCQAAGHTEWVINERFSDKYRRWQNRELLDKLIAGWTENYTPLEVTDLLQRAGVPAGPCLNIEEFINDPHLIEREFFIEPDHPEVGRRVVAGKPWIISNLPKSEIRHAPLLGEHNEYVFRELLGLLPEEMEGLIQEGIIS